MHSDLFFVSAPPRIDRLPGDLYLAEGDNTKIKIYYTGDQPLDVTLTVNQQKVDDSTHIRYTVFDDYIIIFIKDINKTDAGNYNLTVKNENGSASGSFNVYITGLPGPPNGPLETSDITKHTCTLRWKPPSYDGGLRVTHYVVERKDVTGTHWITVASSCRETYFTIQGLTEGQEYLFRVMAVNDNGMGPPLEGVNPVRAKAPFDPPGPPGIPKVTQVGGDFVNLEWTKPENDGGARVQGIEFIKNIKYLFIIHTVCFKYSLPSMTGNIMPCHDTYCFPVFLKVHSVALFSPLYNIPPDRKFNLNKIVSTSTLVVASIKKYSNFGH